MASARFAGHSPCIGSQSHPSEIVEIPGFLDEQRGLERSDSLPTGGPLALVCGQWRLSR
jgi:hypothetical protein